MVYTDSILLTHNVTSSKYPHNMVIITIRFLWADSKDLENDIDNIPKTIMEQSMMTKFV